jgi:short-subunit dehydrogenase
MNTAKVVMITGASSGIGYAAALAFARRGWRVAALARRTERLTELVTAAKGLPGEVLAVEADVRDAAALQRAVAQTVERYGRLDVLAANAGLGQRGALVEADWDDLEVVLRTNIDGVLHSIRAAVPAMRQTGGQIILISSVAAMLSTPYVTTYSATKAFVSSLARSLRLELDADGIAVTDILVGRTATEFDEKRRGAGKRSGGGLPTMTAEQVAEAIVRATEGRPQRMILRPFDRLLLWGNALLPGVMARLARRQYK